MQEPHNQAESTRAEDGKMAQDQKGTLRLPATVILLRYTTSVYRQRKYIAHFF